MSKIRHAPARWQDWVKKVSDSAEIPDGHSHRLRDVCGIATAGAEVAMLTPLNVTAYVWRITETDYCAKFMS